MRNAQAADPGFETKNILLIGLNLHSRGYSPEQIMNFHRQLIERTEALAGVQSASIAEHVPLGMGWSSGRMQKPGSSADSDPVQVWANWVGPHYFKTMGLKLHSGREFTEQDIAATFGGKRRFLIINETLARMFWPGEDPLGKQINGREIIGTVKDSKYISLGESPRPFAYHPFAAGGEGTLHVRSAGEPSALISAIRSEVHALDENMPIAEVKTMSEHLQFALFIPRLAGVWIGVLGLLGLALAVNGVYGVMTWFVNQSMRELGIRIALGAQVRDIIMLVLGQAMKMILAGLCLGLTIAIALTHLFSVLLYGVSATDPLTFTGITLLLALIALLACYFPTRRATRVDPMIALRHE
jgi:predicted permease